MVFCIPFSGISMAKKQTRKKPVPVKKPQDSVFREAWENMSEDMARVMPDFMSKGLQGGKKKLWVVLLVTVVELLVLGAVGKFVYDWFVK
jgi:hypothetical protein